MYCIVQVKTHIFVSLITKKLVRLRNTQIYKAMKTIKLSLVVLLFSIITNSVFAIGYPANLSGSGVPPKRTSSLKTLKKSETVVGLKQTLTNKANSVIKSGQSSVVKMALEYFFQF